MKKLGISLFLFSVTIILLLQQPHRSNAQSCSEFFISEYVEGTLQNKAIEIYNPTAHPKSLSGYFLNRYSNGGSTVAESLALSGIVPAYGTWVVTNGLTDTANINGYCDSVLYNLGNQHGSGVHGTDPFFFNGNDAVTIEKTGGVIVDIFGRVGAPDPGAGWYNLPGLNGDYTTSDNLLAWTKEHTLIRKRTVKTGVTFNPSPFIVNMEWDSLPIDTWSKLGWHKCNCKDAPVIVNNDTSVCLGAQLTLTAATHGAFTDAHWIVDGTVIPTSVDTVFAFNSSLFGAGYHGIKFVVDTGSIPTPFASDSITIQVMTAPQVFLGHDTTVCGTQTITLDAGPGNSYTWYPGGQINRYISVGQGIYRVVVTNTCGTGSDTITITNNNPNAPDLGPDLTVCPGTNVILNPGTGYSNYYWTPGGSNGSTLAPTTSGTYIVRTTNTIGGCVDRDTVVVTFLVPPVQEIELVTLDTTNGNNRITWDNSANPSMVDVKIYREITTNNYSLVGTANYTAGTWTDILNSRNQAFRYKIALWDTCGNEGAQSHYVQSIHSWVTPNIPTGFTLQWTPYQIENDPAPVSQYNIYSGDQLSQLQYTTFVSGSVTVYTLSTFTDSLYVIGAVLSTKAASDDALSNWVSQQDALGIENNAELEFSFSPNPVLTTLSIQCEKSISTLTVYDLTGRLLLNGNGSRIDCRALPAGMYHCVINTDDGLQSALRFVKLDKK